MEPLVDRAQRPGGTPTTCHASVPGQRKTEESTEAHKDSQQQAPVSADKGMWYSSYMDTY